MTTKTDYPIKDGVDDVGGFITNSFVTQKTENKTTQTLHNESVLNFGITPTSSCSSIHFKLFR